MGSESFITGNAESSTVICTFWSLAKPLSEKLDPKTYAVCANLYSLDGINTIVRAIYQNPHWRNLILFGADLTHGGDIIVSFFQNGLEENGKVKGTNFAFQPEIPREALEIFRQNIELIDLRGKGIEELTAVVQNQTQKHPFSPPQSFPEPKLPEFQSFHSEKVGFVVRGKTPSHAWLQILDLIIKFGVEKPTEYGNQMKELLDVQAVIENDDEIFPECVPFSKKDLEEYIPKLLSHQKPENVVYTYGSRLREGFDQVQNAIDYLKKTPHTRRAIAFTWRIREDPQNTNPPCLTQIVWSISNGKLHQTCTFRSHDMYEGWPLNILGLREMQNEVARQTNTQTGSLICLSVSAHIYEQKWDEAKQKLEKYYQPDTYRFDQDPRGNFLIEIMSDNETNQKNIRLQHFTFDGQKTQFVFSPKKQTEKQILEELFTRLAHSNLVSRADHAFYLGAELHKAITAIKQGREYAQDKELS